MSQSSHRRIFRPRLSAQALAKNALETTKRSRVPITTAVEYALKADDQWDGGGLLMLEVLSCSRQLAMARTRGANAGPERAAQSDFPKHLFEHVDPPRLRYQ
jgi:hypothetical protein